MATHQNYFEIEADSYYDLGLRRGVLFGKHLRDTVARAKRDDSWAVDLEKARWYVAPAQAAFPHLIEEVHGFAEGARVCFEETWLTIIEDELVEDDAEKCTTMVANRGTLIAHSEDWERDAKDAICILRKSVGGVSTFELCYMVTLGGNAISVNSHGIVHTINSLSHTDSQLGVPRNIVARWLSESAAPEDDFRVLEKLERASGYHHCLIGRDGRIWSIECTAGDQRLTTPSAPFVHTNHYLTDLDRFEGDDNVPGTRARYRTALQSVSNSMSVEQMKGLLDDASEGRAKSILNERTIGRMIVDMQRQVAHVWLLREREKGWITYSLADELAADRAAVGTSISSGEAPDSTK